MKRKVFGLLDAIPNLAPGALWGFEEELYESIEWWSEDITKPSKKAVYAEISRLQAEYDALEYQRLRAPEYPPIADYLDGVVKGDQAQIDAYIAACIAVKEKYPKPEGS